MNCAVIIVWSRHTAYGGRTNAIRCCVLVFISAMVALAGVCGSMCWQGPSRLGVRVLCLADPGAVSLAGAVAR